MLLAGDIGGTKTNLAIFSAETGPHDPLVEATFPSVGYKSLDVMARTFLEQTGISVTSACFGVAGPVVKERARITNLNWFIDAARLQDSLHISSVHLINDLEAIASAVPILEPTDVHTLNPGLAEPGGTIGVIAPGTGLGEAFLVWDGTRYHAYPSEGGHCSFAPRTPVELDMLRYLLEKYEHVSYERLCSGTGMPNIYDYYLSRQDTEELPHVAEHLATAADPTPIIVNAAMHPTHPSPLCKRTLDTFVSILGAEAGNLGLKVLARGGVYVGGGIPPRILSVLESGIFMQTYSHKGRFGEMVAQMPVYIILNPKAALMGAACVGLHGL